MQQKFEPWLSDTQIHVFLGTAEYKCFETHAMRFSVYRDILKCHAMAVKALIMLDG